MRTLLLVLSLSFGLLAAGCDDATDPPDTDGGGGVDAGADVDSGMAGSDAGTDGGGTADAGDGTDAGGGGTDGGGASDAGPGSDGGFRFDGGGVGFDGGDFARCTMDTDCPSGERCCMFGGFGICRASCL